MGCSVTLLLFCISALGFCTTFIALLNYKVKVFILTTNLCRVMGSTALSLCLTCRNIPPRFCQACSRPCF